MKRLLLACLSTLWIGTAYAAVTGNNFVTAQTPVSGFTQFVSATGAGTLQTVITGGTNGTKVFGLWASSSDATTAHPVACYIFHSTTGLGGSYGVTIATTSGATGSYTGLSYNLLSAGAWPGLPVDSDGNTYFFLAANDTLQCTFSTAITASATIVFYAVGSNY